MSTLTDRILFFDTEISPETGRLCEAGAVKGSGASIRTSDRSSFAAFAADCDFLCGHNIFAHDLEYIGGDLEASGKKFTYIDTLPLSPLLFPVHPSHRLVKDDKLMNDDFNDPLSDAGKARDLFYDEAAAFYRLGEDMQRIFRGLLSGIREFEGFFAYLDADRRERADEPAGSSEAADPAGACRDAGSGIAALIKEFFSGRICGSADVDGLTQKYPAELAYCLALIQADDRYSAVPPWVSRSYPAVQHVMNTLRNKPCREGCSYCIEHFALKARLKEFFGYDEFRRYNGEPLQEQAAEAAVNGKSLLAVFPTGGGKSLTFQLPALIAGETSKGLTVVISPLQSLMKDQVDKLSQRGIVGAVTINGSLDPVERRYAIDQVESGVASILYISPESLRSATIERLLRSRNIVRFVIDEAHCFSAWGQDFRVDYLYIGKFLEKLRIEKKLSEPVPVSCFTATARQKVISDIREYFRDTCGLELGLFATDAERVNLRYEVLYREDDEKKYQTLRSLILSKDCPVLVYVSRTKRTREIASRLSADGIDALPYHGKMAPSEKQENQEAFMSGRTRVIVATTAFGMGIDKDDVGLVIHYNISSSLEDYVQEAGRAGRDPAMDAECCILFNEDDLDKHFRYLNETKLSLAEIRQIWKAVRKLSSKRSRFTRSALEIARAAGWEGSGPETETKVRAAVSALEQTGYISRGRNVPHIYANAIAARSMTDASEKLQSSDALNDDEKQLASRIMSMLVSAKYRARAGTEDAESRVDYIADRLGERTEDVMRCVLRLREEGLIDDSMDMTAYIGKKESPVQTAENIKSMASLELWLMKNLPDSGTVTFREMCSEAGEAGLSRVNVSRLRTVLTFWMRQKYIRREVLSEGRYIRIERTPAFGALSAGISHRINLALFIADYLQRKKPARSGAASAEGAATEASPASAPAASQAAAPAASPAASRTVSAAASARSGASERSFSVLELQTAYNQQLSLLAEDHPANGDDVMLALTWLRSIGALDIDGGFLVLYNAMQIERTAPANRKQYKKEDYRQLDEYYSQRMQQIHIAGEYARLMTKSYEDARAFVSDYFSMDYMLFIRKYFRGNRRKEIDRTITPERYNRLFASLSPVQRRIIDDDRSRHIVVAAGPGSGKTRVLVHKLASLLMLEDVRNSQLLMLTFSRAAASEFRQRLAALIGSPAYYVDIRTFHSFCFEIVGETGTLEASADVVARATEMIKSGEADEGRITRSVLVIDEAQDMDEESFGLVRALMAHNEYMRVIAVGDDDQNIYEFRNSDSKYLRSLVTDHGAKLYEMTENYRSDKSIAGLAARFAETIEVRMKSQEVKSVSSDPGTAGITRFYSPELSVPTADMVRRIWRGESCCVMTAANEEALLMTGLLRKRGLRVRLIQSDDDFGLENLLEIRSFTEMLKERGATQKITQDQWNSSLYEFRERFKASACYEECMRLLDSFGRERREKYLSDFIEFVRESSLSDFVRASEGEVLVSTIHKTKGREFDTVFMMLNNYRADTDAARHVLYVGMTRAKHALYINCNTGIFDRLCQPRGEASDMHDAARAEDLDMNYAARSGDRDMHGAAAHSGDRDMHDHASAVAADEREYNSADRHAELFAVGTQLSWIENAAAQRDSEPVFRRDRQGYPQPDEALISLTHRGVNLGYFRYVYGTVRRLRSGAELCEYDGSLYIAPADARGKAPKGRPVARLSKSAMKDIASLRAAGFEIQKVTVRFIVYWKGREDENETLIILPDIYMKRER